MSFFFSCLSFSSNWERERGYTKFGIRRNSPKGTYLISLMEFRGESFFFYGLIDFMLVLILAWRKWLLRVWNILCLLLPGALALVLPDTNPVQWLTFLTIYFRWREGVPISVLGSQPIIWLLSSSPWSGDFFRATRCHPSPILFPSGHPVKTSVFSILTWVCYFGIDLHSFMF